MVSGVVGRLSLQLQFMGGRNRTITIAATAGNVVSNQSPGVGKRWLLMGGRVKLITDANAANRYVVIQKTDGTNILYNFGRGGVQITGLTRYNSFVAGNIAVAGNWIRSLDLDLGGPDDGVFSLGEAQILSGAETFRITILNGLAGDSYSGFLHVLEVDI